MKLACSVWHIVFETAIVIAAVCVGMLAKYFLPLLKLALKYLSIIIDNFAFPEKQSSFKLAFVNVAFFN